MRLAYVNDTGERVEFSNESRYVLLGVEGLGIPKNILNTQKSPFQDGESLLGQSLAPRPIRIEFAIYKDDFTDMDSLRRRLYNTISPKKNGRLYVYLPDLTLSIKAILSGGLDFNRDMDNDEFMKGFIDLECKNPFFENEEEHVFQVSYWTKLFQFPFFFSGNSVKMGDKNSEKLTTIINDGDVDSGVIMEIKALENVSNPNVKNMSNQSFFKADINLLKGDTLYINTKYREKSVLLYRNGVSTNVLHSLNVDAGKLFYISPGVNTIVGSNETANSLEVIISYCERYLGV